MGMATWLGDDYKHDHPQEHSAHAHPGWARPPAQPPPCTAPVDGQHPPSKPTSRGWRRATAARRFSATQLGLREACRALEGGDPGAGTQRSGTAGGGVGSWDRVSAEKLVVGGGEELKGGHTRVEWGGRRGKVRSLGQTRGQGASHDSWLEAPQCPKRWGPTWATPLWLHLALLCKERLARKGLSQKPCWFFQASTHWQWAARMPK